MSDIQKQEKEVVESLDIPVQTVNIEAFAIYHVDSNCQNVISRA